MMPDTDRKPRRRLRLIVLLCLGALLIGGALVYKRLYLANPVGSGPAGPAVPREPFANAWTTRKVLLLGVGDSITAGYGASPGLSYFERLVRNPPEESEGMKGICLSAVLPNLTVRNMSVSGSTSPEHIEDLRKLAKQPADVLGLVVMTTGGNDVIHDYGQSPPREGAMYGASMEQARPWIANFEKRLETMIDLLQSRFPGGCRVFLADIYDPTDGVGDIERAGLPAWPDGLAVHTAYNQVIRSCAAKRPGVHLVPLHREFLGHGIHCRQFWRDGYRGEDPHYWYYTNLEDPNDRGYDAIRRLFLIELAKVAGQLEAKPATGDRSAHPAGG